jgi:RND family efflux transporter MFP subunit
MRWFFKTRRRKIITLAIVAIIILLQINSARKPDYEVDVYTISKETFTESVTAAGEVKAKKSADLTFVASEIIDDIYVDDGSWVKKGEKIASLNTTNLYQDYKIADAALRAREASLNAVYDDLQGKLNTETYTEISTRTTAETAKDAAVFGFIKAQRNLANAIIKAPFDGVITFKDGVSIGKYASVAAPSFNITDPSTVYFEVEVSELDVNDISPGMKATIELDAFPNETFDELLESVGFVSTFTSSGGTAYHARISLSDNIINRFRLGMNGDAEIVINERDNVISVPTSAVVEEDDKSYVWKVINGGSVVKSEVEIGASAINDTEIVGGVVEGDAVIIRPPSKLSEKDRVKVIKNNGQNGEGLMNIFNQ